MDKELIIRQPGQPQFSIRANLPERSSKELYITPPIFTKGMAEISTRAASEVIVKRTVEETTIIKIPEELLAKIDILNDNIEHLLRILEPIHLEEYVKRLEPMSLDKFMRKLDDTDKSMLQESLRDVKNLPFVKKIEFEEFDNCPTIIIRLSEMNRDTEKKIYQIEYDLLQNFKEYIDFIVFPI